MRTVLLIVAVIVSSHSRQALPDSLAVVPPALIKEQTLSVPGLNFEIDAPKGSRWLMQEPIGPFQVYIAQNTATDIRYSLTIVTSPDTMKLDQEEAEKFLDAFMKQARSRGWEFGRSGCTPSRTRPGSSSTYACTVAATAPEAASIYGYFHISANGTRMYVAHALTVDDREPVSFTQFARSLRFLN